ARGWVELGRRILLDVRATHAPGPPRRRRRFVRLLLLLVTSAWWPWAALALLGAYHGVNPGMGWLFAVARGMQEKSRRAVLSSLLPDRKSTRLNSSHQIIS